MMSALRSRISSAPTLAVHLTSFVWRVVSFYVWRVVSFYVWRLVVRRVSFPYQC
jgi:hypothetical protein